MKIKFLALLSPLVGILLLTANARATTYPEKTVTIVVPYAAGGVTDVFGRAIAMKLSRLWNQNVIIDNRAGGGTIIGTQHVSRAAPDGYTLLLTSYGFTSNPILRKNLPYDPASLTPLLLIGTSSNTLVINANLPLRDLNDILKMAREKPGALTLASSGNGSSPHVAAELFAKATGIQITHIPYKGTSPAMNDILGGQVHGIFDGTSALGQVSTGKLRAIATAAAARHPSSPEVPTFRELGIDLVFGGWFGFFVPRAISQSLQDVIFKDIKRAIADPEVNAVILKTGLVLETQTQEQFKRFLQTESERLRKLTESAGVSITVE
jgi:tripartite-type tricarboxylate transporter receptor subunit TctC